MTGAELIAEARTLVGAPFYHAGRDPERGGVDCIGVILVPAQRLGLTRFEPRTYSPGGEEGYMLECVEQECVRLEEGMHPGDIALFRIRKRLQHLAYLTGTGTMLHSRERIGVVESYIDDRWAGMIESVWRWRALVDEE